ncbi:MAG: glutamine--fructose-6-phosphate transaminase (isomerizing) [Candidatus Saelkia tenebricola]|nr:glutamine--fructose-6-phosphate transaminase (isomerizing) [Candidatus Saelkia tenebricola]
MCGIIGYIGNKQAKNIILQGLKKLEYRGYDSAGIAVMDEKKITVLKCKGKIAHLEELLKHRKAPIRTHVGLGHTRWATHGAPSKKNAHPHNDCSGNITVVHNGIIENSADLKKSLKENGCHFKSETDTEVIAHLISRFYKGDFKAAFIKALQKLKGSYALGIISIYEPDKIFVARNDSSLIIGVGEGENLISSDIPAILGHTRQIISLRDKQIAAITRNTIDVFNFQGCRVIPKIENISYDIDTASKGNFKHFMLKEIFEQPQILSGLVTRYVSSSGNIKFDHLKIDKKFFKELSNITIIACGTAYHAGLIGKYAIESLVRIPVTVDFSSEFRYRTPVIKAKTLIITISQSGETADTLAAVREAKKNRVKVLTICNTQGSSLTRESDTTIYTHAGLEIGVASTKAYTAQLMVLYLVALYLGNMKGVISKNNLQKFIAELKNIPLAQKKVLTDYKNIEKLAMKFLHFGAFLYLGRNNNFPTALEGALKLKEISYIPAEGYAAGEMKHGPIALIDEYRGVICIVNQSPVYNKIISNVQEVLARGGKVIAIATAGDFQIQNYVKEIIFIPEIDNIFSPLLTIVPLQVFAYCVAALKGYDMDMPRNLAKSVTVE